MNRIVSFIAVLAAPVFAQPSLTISPSTIDVGSTQLITLTPVGWNFIPPSSTYGCPSTIVSAFPGQGAPITLTIVSITSTEIKVSAAPLSAAPGHWSIQASNPGSTATLCYTPRMDAAASLTVVQPPPAPTLQPSCNNPPVARVGQPYQHRLAVTGPVSTYAWVPQQLAQGVSLDSSGLISGTFLAPGTVTFTARVTAPYNDGSISGTVQCSIRVDVTGPSLAQIVPDTATACGPGFTLTASGQNFLAASALGFGNGNGDFVQLQTSYGSPGSLRGAIDASLIAQPGDYRIIAANPPFAPENFSNSVPFHVRPAPVISQLNRTNIAAGAEAFTLILTGSNFIDATRVFWRSATGTQSLPIGSLTPTELRVTVGKELIAREGAAQIYVVNAEAANPSTTPLSCSPAQAFTIGPAVPTISSLSPRSATACGPQFTLTVNGANFVSGSQVQWDGTAVPTTLASATQLTAAIPAQRIGNTSRTVPITVASPSGQNAPAAVSTAATFEIKAAPRIDSLSRTSVSAGSGAQTIQINGANFVQGVTQVRWRAGSTTRTLTMTALAPTQLTVQVPADLLANPVTAEISVFNQDEANSSGTASSCSTAASFTVGVPNATISELQPAIVPAYSPDTEIVVTGSNFAPAAQVRVEGSPVATTFDSATRLRAAVPGSMLRSARTLAVTVLNSGASPSTAANLTVSPFSPPKLALTVQAGSNPAQPNAILQFDAAPPIGLNGTVRLRFAPGVQGLPSDYTGDIQFMNGGTSVDFYAAAGQRSVTLPQNGKLQTGTVAGTISLSVSRLVVAMDNANVLPAAAPSTTIEVTKRGPVIDPNYGVRLVNRTANGFDLELAAFANTREVTDALLQFGVAPGVAVDGSSELTISIRDSVQNWYKSPDSLPNGSAFLIRIPIAVTGGNASGIQSATVRLRNSEGTSEAVTSR